MPVANYLDQSRVKLEQFEGCIAWMYRDTAGKVTVGVGRMLPDAEAACALPFLLDGKAATAEQIAQEFARVEALPMGRPALFYRGAACPELAPMDIDSMLRAVLAGFDGELRAHLSGYDSFPDGVKLALLDMAYNLGPAGLLRGYPRLVRAVEAGDWAHAAAACYRHGPGAARNEWTRQMFLTSVLPVVKAAGESGLARLGYGLVGAGASVAGWLSRRLR